MKRRCGLSETMWRGLRAAHEPGWNDLSRTKVISVTQRAYVPTGNAFLLNKFSLLIIIVFETIISVFIWNNVLSFFTNNIGCTSPTYEVQVHTVVPNNN